MIIYSCGKNCKAKSQINHLKLNVIYYVTAATPIEYILLKSKLNPNI